MSELLTAPIRLDEVRGATSLGGIESHAELASTNDRALQLAADEGLTLPFLVVAERQTAGRGRGGNRWWSGEGALLFSLLAAAPGVEEAAPRHSGLSLAVGIAVCEAIEPLLPACAVRVKWPNDVYVDGRKVCGILVESTRTRVVVGVGINVNNSIADAPGEFRETAASLIDAGGRPFDRTTLLIQLVSRICDELAAFELGARDLAARWAPRCYLTGRLVRIESGGRTTVGRCRGIDAEGAILIDTESGTSRFLSGVIAGIDA